MFNLVIKDMKLGVNPWFFVLPLLTGALMLVPGWVYFFVPFYFCCITVPNTLGGFKSQNDLMFSSMMPVTKQDIVRARITVIVILELMHLLVAMLFSVFTFRLYPDISYFFFSPHLGFWGLCFMMLAIFNLVLLPMYYKTAYKYGAATTASNAAALLFAGIAQWIGIQSSWANDMFYGPGVENTALQLSILMAGVLIFVAFTLLAYRMSVKRFLKVELL
ncbi:ABC-2 transporter permease [Paenibacillus sp. 1P07SE]|uniref:ABC-2 transporter permease n=1 Tax=Paenibacillus sp. 1P07SE TaxID=3132209 RepID=UPI0039A57D06